MNRRHYAIPLQQASQESPTLARLTALTRDSSARLKAIEGLIPPLLRPAVQAGPIGGLDTPENPILTRGEEGWRRKS